MGLRDWQTQTFDFMLHEEGAQGSEEDVDLFMKNFPILFHSKSPRLLTFLHIPETVSEEPNKNPEKIQANMVKNTSKHA